MDQRKFYEKPAVVENIKLEAIAGTCTGGKTSSSDPTPGCATLIAS
jgi:hypothetical protein